MKKQKNIIKIGEDFTENKKFTRDYYDFKTLSECYTKCSDTKERIYNYYRNLLDSNSKLISYGVRSFNSMIIVLHAIVEKDGKQYYLVITPSYNWYNEI